MERNERLILQCWTVVAAAVGTLLFTHAGAMLCLLAGHAPHAAAAPVAAGAALGLALWAGARHGLGGRSLAACLGAAFTLAVGAVTYAALFFDFSWDGQWYHQWAILHLARGWNPLADPLVAAPENLQLWVRHYAKGPWYFASAVYQTTGHIEWAKCGNGLAWGALALAGFAGALEHGLSRPRAALLALLLTLNPVIVSGSTTFLVETQMFSLLLVLAAAQFAQLQRPRPLVAGVAAAAALVAINTKLTSTVYVCLLYGAFGLWRLANRRVGTGRWIVGGTATLAAGFVVLGWNPYVTNAALRDHPFYPVAGTAAWPSLTMQGKEGIEKYETPKNMLPLNRVARLAYATFARPGNAPYQKVANAELMVPFGARLADLRQYLYHETRTAGFGPWFSGALLLAAALGGAILLRRRAPRIALLFATAVLLASLLWSPFLWWARYGAQLWLLPLLPIAAVFCWREAPRWARVSAWSLAGLLMANAAIVASVHLRWEARSTATLHRQLAELRAVGRPVHVQFFWSETAGAERLRAAGVPFVVRPRREFLKDSEMLMSVGDGYPGEFRYRIPPAAQAAR